MNEHIKKQWVEALRDTQQWKQTWGALRKEDRFNALGVLCELHRRATGQGEWIEIEEEEEDRGVYTLVVTSYDYSANGELGETYLPSAVVEWAGLRNDNPEVENSSIHRLSDLTHTTLKEFADLIEKEEHL